MISCFDCKCHTLDFSEGDFLCRHVAIMSVIEDPKNERDCEHYKAMNTEEKIEKYVVKLIDANKQIARIEYYGLNIHRNREHKKLIDLIRCWITEIAQLKLHGDSK